MPPGPQLRLYPGSTGGLAVAPRPRPFLCVHFISILAMYLILFIRFIVNYKTIVFFATIKGLLSSSSLHCSLLNRHWNLFSTKIEIFTEFFFSLTVMIILKQKKSQYSWSRVPLRISGFYCYMFFSCRQWIISHTVNRWL